MEEDNLYSCSIDLYAHKLRSLVERWSLTGASGYLLFKSIKEMVINIDKEIDMMNDKLWENINYFDKEEWKKDPSKASRLLVYETDKLRGRVVRPCYIHVCWDDSGHSANSYHYTGQAVDIHFQESHHSNTKSKEDLFTELLCILQSNNINGIGFYPDWEPRPGWHIDVRNREEKLLWARIEGKYVYGVDAIFLAFDSLS